MSLFLVHRVSGTELSRRLTRSTFIFQIQQTRALTVIRRGFSRLVKSAFFFNQFEKLVFLKRLQLGEPSFNFFLYVLVRNALSRVKLQQTSPNARDKSRLFFDRTLLFRHT